MLRHLTAVIARTSTPMSTWCTFTASSRRCGRRQVSASSCVHGVRPDTSQGSGTNVDGQSNSSIRLQHDGCVLITSSLPLSRAGCHSSSRKENCSTMLSSDVEKLLFVSRNAQLVYELTPFSCCVFRRSDFQEYTRPTRHLCTLLTCCSWDMMYGESSYFGNWKMS